MQLVIKRFGQLTAKELYQILSLRAETFIVDQQIMYNDLDNVDQVSTHVFYQDTDSVAAYLRIIDTGQSYNSPLIGRVCVSNKGAGIGSKLLHDTLDYLAQESSASKVLVESQLKAQPFYERAGFTQVSSKVLDHFGVLHHVLSLDLDAYRQTRNAVSIDDATATSIVPLSQNQPNIREIARYTIDGCRILTPQKGINIVKYSDGSVCKEMVTE